MEGNMNNPDSSTASEGGLMYGNNNSTISSIIWGLLYITTALVAFVGNGLVLAVYNFDKKLKKTTNCYLLSLSTADFLVAILVLPFASKVEISGSWDLGQTLCDIWVTLDVLLCTASILSLCCISLDRYLSMVHPFWYKAHHGKLFARKMVAGVWILSTLVTIPPLLGWKEHDRGADPKNCHLTRNVGYIIYSALCSFFVPLLFLLVVNIRIFHLVYNNVDGARKLYESKNHLIFSSSRIKIAKKSRNTDVLVQIRLTEEVNIPLVDFCPLRKTKSLPQLLGNKDPQNDAQGGSNLNYQDQFEANKSILSRKQLITRVKKNSEVSTRHAEWLDLALPHVYALWKKKPVLQEVMVNGMQDNSSKGQNKECEEENVLLSKGKAERQPNIASSVRQRAARSLFLIVGCFVVCWTPFFILYIIGPFCEQCEVSPTLWTFATWLGYSNSMWNPFVYVVCIQNYRKVICALLKRKEVDL